MKEKIYRTRCGSIHYWIQMADPGKKTLVFLPGLAADHRLFERQVGYFEKRYNVFVWDAPGHGVSWPFSFEFDLMDKAVWLKGIFDKENIKRPIIIGQSMGGYVGQAYSQLYPKTLNGFIAIDSAPLQKKYVTGIELWVMKRMEPLYYYCPWKQLLKSGTDRAAVSDYGRNLMHDIIMGYYGNKKRYAQVCGHGFRILADAMEKDLPYEITCPALLVCGKKDRAFSCIRYNRAWHKDTGIPLIWIEGAGHNSNTDQPDMVNRIIEGFVMKK